MLHQAAFHFILYALHIAVCTITMYKLFYFIHHFLNGFFYYFLACTGEAFFNCNGNFLPVIGFRRPISFGYLHENFIKYVVV